MLEYLLRSGIIFVEFPGGSYIEIETDGYYEDEKGYRFEDTNSTFVLDKNFVVTKDGSTDSVWKINSFGMDMVIILKENRD